MTKISGGMISIFIVAIMALSGLSLPFVGTSTHKQTTLTEEYSMPWASAKINPEPNLKTDINTMSNLEVGWNNKIHPSLRHLLNDDREVMISLFTSNVRELQKLLSPDTIGIIGPITENYGFATLLLHGRQIKELASYPFVHYINPYTTETEDKDSTSTDTPNIYLASNSENEITSIYALDHHGAKKAHKLGFKGTGVKVGIIDSGVDFGNPDLWGTQARYNKPGSPYHGWPIAYDDISMANYFGLPTGIRDLTYPGTWYADTSITQVAYDTNNDNIKDTIYMYHTIKIDGKNDFWKRKGTPWYELKATDSAPDDISETNLDVSNLYVSGDKDNWYFGFSAKATNWDMWYCIYIDTDFEQRSGGDRDPRDNYVKTSEWHYPEVVVYIRHCADGTMKDAYLYTWDKSTKSWKNQSLSSVGGAMGYSTKDKFVELKIPLTVFKGSTRIFAEIFTTGCQNRIRALSTYKNLLASGGDDYAIYLWDIPTGKSILIPTGDIRCLSFSPNGTWLAAGLGNSTIMIWNTTGHSVRSLVGHSATVTSISWASNGTWLVSGSVDKTIKIWDVVISKEYTGITGPGPYFNNSLDDWNIPGNYPIAHRSSISSVDISRDGTKIVSGSADTTIKIWDWCAPYNYLRNERLVCTLKHDDEVTFLEYSPDGSKIATGSKDKTVRIWDAKNGSLIKILAEGHTGRITAVRWSTQGDKLATASTDKLIKIWDTSTWKLLKNLTTEFSVDTIVWTSDGKSLISASTQDIPILIWDVSQGKISKKLQGHIHYRSRPQDTVPYDGNVPHVTPYPDWSEKVATIDSFELLYHPSNKSYNAIYRMKGIVSKSGNYHIGYLPDERTHGDTEYPAILVVDSSEPNVYDRVYIDLNKDKNFSNDKPVFKGNEISYVDDDGDGHPEVSGGLLYWIHQNYKDPKTGKWETPIPYTDIYCETHETPGGGKLKNIIPSNGSVVCFMFDSRKIRVTPFANGGETDGTAAASVVVGRGKTMAKDVVHNKWVPVCEGLAPNATIIPIRGIKNVDSMYFAVWGYDGKPGTGDEANVVYHGLTQPTTLESGWDTISRMMDYISRVVANGTTAFVVGAGENGPGYGTIAPPGGMPGIITTGTATEMFFGYFDLVPGGNSGRSPYPPHGDIYMASSRGPTVLGTQGVDIVTAGFRVFAAWPIYIKCGGNASNGLWGGYGAATSVATGLVALIYDAYYQKYGRYPTVSELKDIITTTADDINYDPYVQGSGYANAYRGCMAANAKDGLLISPGSWNPGTYRGSSYTAFTKLMFTKDDPDTPVDETTATQVFKIENRNPTKDANVRIECKVLEKFGEYEYYVNDTVNDWWQNVKPNIPEGTELLKIVAYTNSSLLKEGREYWLRVYDGISATIHPEVTGGKCDEKGHRMNQDTSGSSILEVRTQSPLSRTHEALWVNLAPRPGSPGGVYWHVKLEFYKKKEWKWVSLDQTSLTIPKSSSRDVRAVVKIPKDAPTGSYECALYLRDIRPSAKENILKVSAYMSDKFVYEGSELSYIHISLSSVVKEPQAVNPGSPYVLLKNKTIYPGTYEIYKNNTLMKENVDYTINLDTGLVKFAYNLTVNDTVNATYSSSNYPYKWAQLLHGNVTKLVELKSNGTQMPPNRYKVDYPTGLITFLDILKNQENVTVKYYYFKPVKSVDLSHGYVNLSYEVKDFTHIADVKLFNDSAVIPSTEYTVDYYNGIIHFKTPPLPGANIFAIYNYSYDSTVPITLTIGTHNVVCSFGGKDTYNKNMLFSNYEMYSYTDTRYFYTDIPENFVPSPDTKFYVNISWKYNQSQYNVYMFGKITKDKPSMAAESIYGPYPLAKVDENTNKVFSPQKIAALTSINGLTVYAIRNILANGTESSDKGTTCNVDMMTVTPTEFKLYTNNPTGKAKIKLSSSARWPGVGAIARGPSAPQVLTNVFLPPGVASWPACKAWPNVGVVGINIQSCILLDIWVYVKEGEDVDICLHHDTNNHGVFDGPDIDQEALKMLGGDLENLAGSGEFGGGEGAHEHIKILRPYDDTYFLIMNYFSARPPGTTVDIHITAVQGLGFKTDLPIQGVGGAPDVDPKPVPPYKMYTFNLVWIFAGNDTNIHRPGPRPYQDSTYMGIIYIGPNVDPMSFVIPISLTLDRGVPPDYSKPKISNLKPENGSVTNTQYPTISADYEDTSCGIDTESVKLYLNEKIIPEANVASTGVAYVPTDPLPEGKYTVRLEVSDKAGNTNTTKWTFTIDLTKPSLSITSPKDDITFTNKDKWTVEGTTDALNVTVNGKPAKVIAGKFELTIDLRDTSLSGYNTVIVRATDEAGNTVTIERKIVSDRIPPSFEYFTTSVSGLTNQNEVTIDGKIRLADEYNQIWDVKRSELKIGDEKIDVQSDGIFSKKIPLTTEGKIEITVTAKDAVGNTYTETREITRDVTKPRLSVEAPESSSKAEVLIKITATDPSGILIVKVNGKSATKQTNDTYTKTVILTQKENKIVIVAVDMAGNTATQEIYIKYAPLPVAAIAVAVVIIIIIVVIVVGALIVRKKKKEKEEEEEKKEEVEEGEKKKEEVEEGEKK